MAFKTLLELDVTSPSIFIGKRGDGTISFGPGQPESKLSYALQETEIKEGLKHNGVCLREMGGR